MLLGRRSECAALDELMHAVRAGQSRVLVLRGEPGVGKTALLEYVADPTSGFRFTRAAGVESEMELVYAGVHQLCEPMLGRLDRLPGPQRAALETAFGLSVGGPPDRFLIGLAMLSLLSDAAEDRPLLCVVDDAQWLDAASAQVLAFVARRLHAESVALLLSLRDPSEADQFAGLPELRLNGLAEPDARDLLASAVLGPVDEDVADRIVAETGGNPLALVELPRGLSPAELAGGFGLTTALPLPGQIERSFRRRLEPLPPATQRLLLLAAAEPVGDAALLWRASERLGIAPESAAPAEAEGLVRFGGRVRFRHPLVRSAIYQAAPEPERRAVHRALAEATDPRTDPDRRAWHLAEATLAPDETVAEELERSAARAQARGGLAAAAAFLERASALTPDPNRRAGRALSAAGAELAAGAPDQALALLVTAERGTLDELQRAHLDRLRGMISFAQLRGSEAHPLLLKAAKRLETLDPDLARETYLEALWAATFDGRFGNDQRRLATAEAAHAAPPRTQPPRALDLFLDGLALRFTAGYAACVPTLKRALDAHRSEAPAVDDGRWIWLAVELWDDESWYQLATRQVHLAREAGALRALPLALHYLAGVNIQAGKLHQAVAMIEEAQAITTATGSAPMAYAWLVLLGWRGQEEPAFGLIDAILQEATVRGEGMAITGAEYAAAVVHNGHGRYGRAFASAQRAAQHEEPGVSSWVLPELIEAAARSGRTDVAAAALERFSQSTQASGTDWALGMEAQSRALLSEGRDAEGGYREAIDRLGRSRIQVQLARSRLLYGEWLRRERRRVDAREQLRIAYEMFATMGAEGFAARAAHELLATGEKARKRTVETSDQLTAQETQIATLARDGLSNPEIAAQLFISPRTVEYHLHKVFTKLGIRSRAQLDRALPVDAG